MSRLILASLRRRSGRPVALLLGLLVATTGFTVLTGTTQAARLQVTGTVAESSRGAYDILVRPAGTRTDLEVRRGLVQPNFLASQYVGFRTGGMEIVAVDDVSLEFRAGSMTAVTSPSGSASPRCCTCWARSSRPTRARSPWTTWS